LWRQEWCVFTFIGVDSLWSTGFICAYNLQNYRFSAVNIARHNN